MVLDYFVARGYNYIDGQIENQFLTNKYIITRRELPSNYSISITYDGFCYQGVTTKQNIINKICNSHKIHRCIHHPNFIIIN